MKNSKICIGILLIFFGSASLLILLNFIDWQLSILVFSSILILVGLVLAGAFDWICEGESEKKEQSFQELNRSLQDEESFLRLQMDAAFRRAAQRTIEQTRVSLLIRHQMEVNRREVHMEVEALERGLSENTEKTKLIEYQPKEKIRKNHEKESNPDCSRKCVARLLPVIRQADTKDRF